MTVPINLIVRYFKIDFHHAFIHIRSRKEDEKGRIFPFSNVLNVVPDNKNKKFQHLYSFIVETKEREFELFAPTPEEKAMWVAGFTYVLKSTRITQEII